MIEVAAGVGLAVAAIVATAGAILQVRRDRSAAQGKREAALWGAEERRSAKRTSLRLISAEPRKEDFVGARFMCSGCGQTFEIASTVAVHEVRYRGADEGYQALVWCGHGREGNGHGTWNDVIVREEGS